MNIKKAKEILDYNFLNLNICGIDRIPVNIIEIDSFQIDEDESKDYVYLYGLFEIKKSIANCRSFFVKVNNIYYYREYFSEAMIVIEALRLINNFEYYDSYFYKFHENES